MIVDKRNIWNFANLLPPEHMHDELELIIPDAIQMQWLEFPPFFYPANKTARDLADIYYCYSNQLKLHPDKKTVLNIDWTNILCNNFDKDTALPHLLEI